MTHDQAIKKLRELVALNDGDIEANHVQADTVLCLLLDELGYKDVTALYDCVTKWYA